MKAFLYLTAGMSAVLLLLSIYGHVSTLPMAMPSKGERFEPDLVATVQSMDALDAEAKRRLDGDWAGLGDEEKMERLFQAVTARFAHGSNRHSFSSNWILWLAGHVVESTGYIRDPNRLLRISSHALCSQQSYVLMNLAAKNGIPVRHVGLNGHVVMEAWYDDAWHMYDPDYEVVPKAQGRVLSVTDLERDATLIDDAYTGIETSGLKQIYTTTQDNTYATVPQGAYFNWKAQVLMYIEMVTDWLKFLIPLVALSLSVWALKRRA